MKNYIFLCLLGLSLSLVSQESVNQNDFRQLKQELATPNVYRTASGAPGHEYYQQKADYNIDIILNDNNQSINGKETITYTNNSPDVLSYLWIQLDQNIRSKNSDTKKIKTNSIPGKMNTKDLKSLHNDFDGGFKLDYVKDANGKDIEHVINKTMMRIDLAKPLKPGSSTQIKLSWRYNINDRMVIDGRSGYEFFEKDSNYLYTIAQFYPRMAVYNDVEGWQNKQFLGRGEFALPFGDYQVNITVPADHIVSSTGKLQNPSAVLSTQQQTRLKEAQTASEPIIIVTQDEAEENEKGRSSSTKTWTFKAENVRDFAFASSRKFIWDAWGIQIGGKTVMAMSYYPKEGNPLWEQFSTRAVAHTLKTYSKYTFDYPYHKAISVHSKSIGMEYPMICFNFGRPEEDGTYSERTKYGMLMVIIHEVGHNFFPMIINSDERQWTWMDEGLNTFLQYLTEQEWDRNYPSRRGPPANLVDYMKGNPAGMTPVMTNAESIFQLGNNAYGKPATALVILRETIMGRELFDYAFKEYCRRWKFKHPTPADFFRTMEDASGVDLDWFWRGWFYGKDPVDISIDDVAYYKIDSKNPAIEKKADKITKENSAKFIGHLRNDEVKGNTIVEQYPEANDFYNTYDPYAIDTLDNKSYEKFRASLTADEKEIIDKGFHYYELSFSNLGGLPMPIILEFTLEDGKKKREYMPAEIWKMNAKTVSKVFYFESEVLQVTLDPNLETADIDLSNNFWPSRKIPSKFEVYKRNKQSSENKMQRQKRAEELLEKE